MVTFIPHQQAEDPAGEAWGISQGSLEKQNLQKESMYTENLLECLTGCGPTNPTMAVF